jgi:hypothetical protein
MENIQVDVKRDAVPEWAAPDQRTQQLNGEPPASQAQLDFIRSLLTKKDLSPLTDAEKDAMARIQTEEPFWATGTTRLTKAKASRILDRLIPLKDLPREQQREQDIPQAIRDLPAGRYALPKAGTTLEENELRFYQCWESRDKKAKRIYVMFGPSSAKMPMKVQLAIALKIHAAGIRECAIRYGMEIRECSNCGRRLTNRISRELGIGPVCGGRMFGEDEWKGEVKTKRNEIIARGEDPDEELE